MFHVELRRFPHNFCRFNLSEPELRALVLDAWRRGQPVELGERRWSPHEATLTVLEGPELPVQDLALGRGWRNAQRRSRDVTAEVLRAAPAGDLAGAAGPVDGSAAVGASGPVAGGGVVGAPGHATEAGVAGAPGPVDAAGPAHAATDTLAADLVSLLGDDAEPLLRAWQLALQRHPDKSPSECLALAEDLVRR